MVTKQASLPLFMHAVIYDKVPEHQYCAVLHVPVSAINVSPSLNRFPPPHITSNLNKVDETRGEREKWGGRRYYHRSGVPCSKLPGYERTH